MTQVRERAELGKTLYTEIEELAEIEISRQAPIREAEVSSALEHRRQSRLVASARRPDEAWLLSQRPTLPM